MTLPTEALHGVTTRALRIVPLGGGRMGGEEVATVYACRPHPAVVAIGALVLLVALSTEFSPVRGHPPVTHEEVRVVIHAVQPPRGKHRCV